MKHNKNKKGFTIVELVIVIGVIGILAGILIPTFVNVTKNAEAAALQSNLANAYSSYAAEAADGVIDEGANKGEPIVFKGQSQVSLTITDKGSEVTFVYDSANGKWISGDAKDTFVVTISADAAASKAASTFGGAVVKYNAI